MNTQTHEKVAHPYQAKKCEGNPSNIHGCIDLVKLRLEHAIDIQGILERAESIGMKRKETRAHGRRSISLYFDEEPPTAIYFGYYGDLRGKTRYISFRPSAYGEFRSIHGLLVHLFGRNEVESATIQRIDLTTDIKLPFTEVFPGLDVSHKRLATSFIASAGRVTGGNFGSGNHKVVVYDKAHKEKVATAIGWTRIEIQIGGSSIPFQRITDLYGWCDLIAEGDYRPFDNIRLYKIRFPKVSPEDHIVRYTRQVELKTLTKRLGFSTARRMLNENRTFRHRYDKTYTKTALNYDLSSAWIRSIRRYVKAQPTGMPVEHPFLRDRGAHEEKH